jgi:cyclopropane-fatty-acyl-phospholipid synthase
MIKFSSKAAGDVFMLDDHGRQLLEIIGKPAQSKGVITPEEIAAALNRLRQAIARDDDAEQPDTATDEAAGRDDIVALRRRAFPLMDMLERAQRKNTEVAWGI